MYAMCVHYNNTLYSTELQDHLHLYNTGIVIIGNGSVGLLSWYQEHITEMP